MSDSEDELDLLQCTDIADESKFTNSISINSSLFCYLAMLSDQINPAKESAEAVSFMEMQQMQTASPIKINQISQNPQYIIKSNNDNQTEQQ